MSKKTERASIAKHQELFEQLERFAHGKSQECPKIPGLKRASIRNLKPDQIKREVQRWRKQYRPYFSYLGTRDSELAEALHYARFLREELIAQLEVRSARLARKQGELVPKAHK